MKIKKLDKRHTGHGTFKFMVEFTRNEHKHFFDIRNWCWETWGPACEVDLMNKWPSALTWAWQNSEWNVRVYLASDKEANWYKLRWGV
jgi:hypothetical protein